MKQTAVEFQTEKIGILVSKLFNDEISKAEFHFQRFEICEQAKEMEKQQQDEFAIDFAEWLEDSIYKENNFIKMDVVKRIKYTTKELLEIYKKEQFKNK